VEAADAKPRAFDQRERERFRHRHGPRSLDGAAPRPQTGDPYRMRWSR